MSGRGGDTRPLGSPNYQQSPVYRELQKSIHEAAERTEAVFERLEKRLDRMDRDLARTDQGQDRLANELVEIRRDIGELRDATHIAASKAATEAKTAVSAIAHKRWWERWQAWAVAFVAIVAFFKNIGPTARGIESFWTYLQQSDRVAEVRQIEAEKK